MNLPGLNTLGISMSRLDFAPDSMFSPHYHPHASEILVFIEGTLEVGFVSSTNNLFMKVSKKGNAYMFPQGLIHSQYNPGKTNGVAFSGLNSQNPGAVFVAKAVFGSKPAISSDVLTKAFQLDKKTIDRLQAQFTGVH